MIDEVKKLKSCLHATRVKIGQLLKENRELKGKLDEKTEECRRLAAWKECIIDIGVIYIDPDE